MAQQLSGVAHVFQEYDKNTSLKLKEATDSKNAYNGYVGIYFPKSKHHELFSRDQFKNNDELNSSKRSALKDIGFIIDEDVTTHYKLVFYDPRYTFSVAKTPGDHRGGKNQVSDMSKILDVERKFM